MSTNVNQKYANPNLPASIATDANKRIALITPAGAFAPIKNLPRSGTVGTRIVGVETGTVDNSTVATYRAIFEVPAGFDAVRPIFANGGAAAYTPSATSCRPMQNMTDFTFNSSGVGQTVTVPVAVPARLGLYRPSYELGNWTQLPSVARNDGGSGSLVCFDTYISTAAVLTIFGGTGSGIDVSGWATRANRKFAFLSNAGDCVTTPGNFVSTALNNFSPIVGLQYASRGKIITVMGVGDSITFGEGTIKGEGFIVPACEQATAATGIYYECMNLGWPGQVPDNYTSFLGDLAYAGIMPDICVCPVGSPNSATPITSITNALPMGSQQGAAYYLNTLLSNARGNEYRNPGAFSQPAAQNQSVQIILWTMLPVSHTVHNWSATATLCDPLRVGLNNQWLNNSGVRVLDFATAFSGSTYNGQIEPNPALTTDLIHPNDAGNAVLSPILATELMGYF